MINIISNEFENERVYKLRTVSSSSGHSSSRFSDDKPCCVSSNRSTRIGCLRLVALVVFACMLLLQSVPLAEGLAYPYNLMGVPPRKPMSPPSTSTNMESGEKLVTTATNSPIYYINKLDLSSLFLNLLPDLQQSSSAASSNKHRYPIPMTTPNPLLEALVASAIEEAKINKTRMKTKTTKPFKRIPLPFVSNAKPVASYELTSTDVGVTDAAATAVPITSTPSTIILSTKTTSKPWMSKYPPSKLIRLKTKFVANGHPSAVYVFKSPLRRYFMHDLLRRPAVAAAQVDKRHGSELRRRQPAAGYRSRNPRKNLQ